MEALQKREEIINLIFENLKELRKEDLIAISDFSSSISNIGNDEKQINLIIARLKEFYTSDYMSKITHHVVNTYAQSSVREFNKQPFSYLQRVFTIEPDVVDFLLKESTHIINVFLVQKKDSIGKECLDIVYKNGGDNKYYCMDRMNGANGLEIGEEDFSKLKTVFDNDLKIILDPKINAEGCPSKVMIDKSDLEKFNSEFKNGKLEPKVDITTAINLVRQDNLCYYRVSLVMNFISKSDDIFIPDNNFYFDTYHLCPPGSC